MQSTFETDLIKNLDNSERWIIVFPLYMRIFFLAKIDKINL